MLRFVWIAIAAAAIALPSPARAWVDVTGECYSTGPIAGVAEIASINANITQMEGTISTMIFQVGQSLDESLMQMRAAAEKENEFLVDAIYEAFQKEFAAKEARELQKTIGSESRPRGMCGITNVSTQVSQTIEAAEKVRVGLVKNSEEVGKSMNSMTAALASANRINPDEVDLNPEAGVLTDEEAQELTKALNFMADPVPSLPVPEDQVRTDAGLNSLVGDKKRQLYLKEVRNVLSRKGAWYTTKISNTETIESIQKLYENYGAGLDAPQIKNGEISLYGLYDFYSNLRFSSINWPVDVAHKGSLFQQREQTLMQAIQLKLQFEQLKEQKSIAMLLAQLMADSVAKEKQVQNTGYQSRFNSQN